MFQGRLTTARSGQWDIGRKRFRQVFRIDSDLRHVAIRVGAGEESAAALINKNVEHGVIEGRVGGMSMCFPAAIREIELDGATDWAAIVQPNNGIRKIGTCGAIPSAKLDDFNLIAGDRLEASPKITSEPACLQFQFAGHALSGKEGAFVETRATTQLGIMIRREHWGGRGDGI